MSGRILPFARGVVSLGRKTQRAAVSTVPAILGLCLLAHSMLGHADDLSGDLTVVRAFLDKDRSYSASRRQQAETEFRALQEKAANTSPAAFQLAVARIAALAGNGHTMLMPGVWSHQFNRTPLEYYVFADGLFVVHAPEPLRHLLGARVAALEGHDLDALRATYSRYSGGSTGKRDEWMVHFLESPALLHAAGVASVADRVTLSLVLADGTAVTQPLTASLAPPGGSRFAFFHRSRLVTRAAENVGAPENVPLYLAEPDRFFRVESLAELDAWYIQLRANATLGEQKLDRFLDSVRSTLKKATPRTVIVDLRFDGGGDLNLTRSFLQALPSLVAADGRIFAITSGRTFSAGITSLGYLEQAGGERVTIVGEPVGDGLAFWAEGQPMELPSSKAVLLPATERHDYITGCQEPDCHGSIRKHPIRVASLQPDVAAPLTYTDYRAGRDPALETIRQGLVRK